MSQLLEIYFTTKLYFALIDVQENNFQKIYFNCLAEVVYYLKLVFHLLFDKSLTSAEELLYFSLIL